MLLRRCEQHRKKLPRQTHQLQCQLHLRDSHRLHLLVLLQPQKLPLRSLSCLHVQTLLHLLPQLRLQLLP